MLHIENIKTAKGLFGIVFACAEIEKQCSEKHYAVVLLKAVVA